MSLENVDWGALDDIPNAQRVIVATGNDPPTLRIDGAAHHSFRVAFEGMD